MGLFLLPFFGIIAFAGVIIFFGWQAQKKRRESLLAWSQVEGFSFSKEKNRAIPTQYDAIDIMRAGSNRYAYNTMRGSLKECGKLGELPLIITDYHYETHSSDGKGNRQTHHHHNTLLLVDLPFYFPAEIRIRPENFLDRIVGAIGFDDIDFESGEFSRKYFVKSKDRKLAYDIIHPRMMDFLLSYRGMKPSFELDHSHICLMRSGQIKPDELKTWMTVLARFIALFPEFVRQDLQSRE